MFKTILDEFHNELTVCHSPTHLTLHTRNSETSDSVKDG